MSHGSDSTSSIIYALVANGAIAVAKLIAAFITGSGSMMAESIHSLADCGNQGLLLYGLKSSKRPPTPDHPLGHGKDIYFWSFIVALMLFSMGGLFSIYEGTHKLSEPGTMSYPIVAVGVLVFSILAEGASLAGCIKEVNKERGKDSLMQWFRNTRQSEMLVVFGEDLAAMFGLTFALGAVVLTWVTGNPIYDAAGSIVIGVLLLIIAVFIGVEVKALLIGQGVDPKIKAKMIEFLESSEEVEKVYNLLTLQMGSDIMVAVKAKMIDASSITGTDLINGINKTEAAFKAEFPQTMWLFFEPDHQD